MAKTKSGLNVLVMLILNIGILAGSCYIASSHGTWHGVGAGVGIAFLMATFAVFHESE